MMSMGLLGISVYVGNAAQVAGLTHRAAEMMETVGDVKQFYDEIEGEGRVVPAMGSMGASGVTCTAPDGAVLVRGLTFTVTCGHNLIVVGPSGCGKSSIGACIAHTCPPSVSPM